MASEESHPELWKRRVSGTGLRPDMRPSRHQVSGSRLINTSQQDLKMNPTARSALHRTPATTEEFSPHDQLRREPPNRAARSSENTAGTPWTLSTVTSSVTATTGRFYLGSTSSSTEELGQDPIWNETNDALDAFCSSLPHPGSSRLASRLIPSATTKRGDHLRHLDAGADHGWKTPGSPASAARRRRTVRELLRICRATG